MPLEGTHRGLTTGPPGQSHKLLLLLDFWWIMLGTFMYIFVWCISWIWNSWVLWLELNMITGIRTNKGFLFIACSKGLSHHHMCLAETQKAGGEVGKIYSEKWKRLLVRHDGRLLACGSHGVIEAGIQCIWWGLHIWLFPIVAWTAERSNQAILKEINPEYSLERLMLKLKLQYFGHLMWRANSLEKIMVLGKIEGRRRRRQQRTRWLDGSRSQWTWVWANSGRWWRTGKPGVLQSMGLQRVRHDSVTEQQQLFLRWKWGQISGK